MAMIEVVKAAKNHGVRTSQIHSARLDGNVPRWMEKRGVNWYVDDKDNDFILFLKSKIKKSNIVTFGKARAKRKQEIGSTELSILSMDETQKLQELSIQADLSTPIVKLRLETYKIEQQKMKLEIHAGNYVSRQMAEYLYLGYIDRLNRELLQYRNKLEIEFDHIIADVVVKTKAGEHVEPRTEAKRCTAHIDRETCDIIRNIKAAQLKELKQWAKDEGVDL
jgi:hypothetical protein